MNTLNFAKQLRQNQTDSERLLWHYLRNKQFNGLKFKRQYPIGPYIVDFICYQKGLIIELDGGQHNNEANKLYDTNRTKFFEENGYKVIRFWDNDVQSNLSGVLETILENIATSPWPSPTRRGNS